jgi:hypothetical protein
MDRVHKLLDELEFPQRNILLEVEYKCNQSQLQKHADDLEDAALELHDAILNPEHKVYDSVNLALDNILKSINNLHPKIRDLSEVTTEVLETQLEEITRAALVCIMNDAYELHHTLTKQ